MPTLCPTCRRSFADDDVNVAKDVAYCRGCDKAYALSELARGLEAGDADLSMPPKGAWYRDDGVEVSLGSTWRSPTVGVFFLIFTVFWNSVTWSILGAMIGGAANVHGPGITHSNGVTTVAPTAYLLFIPFVLVGLGTALAAAVIWFGRAELTIRGNDAVLFRGVGGLGLRSRFDLSTVTGVGIATASWTRNNQPVHHISIEGPGINFGTGFSKDQQKFLVAAIRKVAGV
jgi:hypothetical protein